METTNTTDLTCSACEGRGFISGLAGCSGFGDPEDEFVTEECGCFAGSLRCGGCLRAEAVVLVADGTATPLPLCVRCKAEGSDLEVANVKSPTGEPSRADGAGASAPMSPVLSAVDSRRAAIWAELDREWLAAGAEIRAERARGAA
jgi:hypothetical protein